MKALILASSSRYRRDLLARLGLPFETSVPAIDETPEPGELPAALAARLAHAKATSIHRADADAIVIGSDQVASLEGRLLGKPGNHASALEQLEACQGQEVVFHTAVCISAGDDRQISEHVDLTRVRFRQHSRAELASYLEQEPAYDCAGGFKVEGLGIVLFEAIESHDPTALIGLPMIWLAGALRSVGLDPLA
jgi:septum formation protein